MLPLKIEFVFEAGLFWIAESKEFVEIGFTFDDGIEGLRLVLIGLEEEDDALKNGFDEEFSGFVLLNWGFIFEDTGPDENGWVYWDEGGIDDIACDGGGFEIDDIDGVWDLNNLKGLGFVKGTDVLIESDANGLVKFKLFGLFIFFLKNII